jgi:hypothetical protein
LRKSQVVRIGRPAAADQTWLFGNCSDVFAVADARMKIDASAMDYARCVLRLANLPNFAIDRLSRRQAGRILHALETLDRGKPQERSRRFVLASEAQLDPE